MAPRIWLASLGRQPKVDRLISIMKTLACLLFLTCVTVSAQNSWTNRFRNVTPSGSALASYGTAVAVDASGNVAVAGKLMGTNNLFDIFTVDYAANGSALWTNRCHVSAVDSDQAIAVAFDPSGNVFVLGLVGVSSEFATIKYSSAGVPQWTNRYDGPVHQGASPLALAVDTNGNAFVTGSGYGGNATFFDITTVKYNSNGTTAWVRSYNGSRNLSDFASVIALDATGNVFVAGYTPGVPNGIDGNYDIAVIKYSNSGTALWTNQFSGPAGFNDQPTAIAADSNGDVLVTGWANQNGGNANVYVTLKYSSGGVPLWTNYFALFASNNEKGVGVAVDNNRDVYVTGTGGASGRFATLKYTSTGVPVWTNAYVNPFGGSVLAKGIAVDADSNVFVTGYGTGSPAVDYVTLKYSSAGTPIWTNRYNGPGNNDSGVSDDETAGIVVDVSGNAIITGFSTGTTNVDCVTIKYAAPAPPAPFFIVTTNSHFGFSNQLFSFDVTGPANSNVVVLGSSNLQNWVALRTNSLGSGLYYFNDTQTASNRLRFYRAQLLP